MDFIGKDRRPKRISGFIFYIINGMPLPNSFGGDLHCFKWSMSEEDGNYVSIQPLISVAIKMDLDFSCVLEHISIFRLLN